MASTESEIRESLDRRSEAAWDKDLDRLMSLYAPEVVYFDVVPPLRYVGADALRERFRHWFTLWDGPIGQQLGDLTVMAGGEFAAAYMLVRASGTLKIGREVGYWIRVTDCFRRSAGGWLVTHEHVSLPVDVQSGTVVMDLVP
ncbi:MAG: YybH family protein [Natronosporangium sp.]